MSPGMKVSTVERNWFRKSASVEPVAGEKSATYSVTDATSVPLSA